jgi:hypothetical protein
MRPDGHSARPGDATDGDGEVPTTRHELTMCKLQSWLAGGAKSPNEQVVKNRLREISGIVERNK